MNKKVLGVFGAAILVAIIVIVVIQNVGGSVTPAAVKEMKTQAISFPAPDNVTVGQPDNSEKSPPSYTKFWTDNEAIDAACSKWREAFRGWIGAQNVGQVTGSVTPGQSCSYTGPKDKFKATLAVSVFGTDPKPQVTLSFAS